MKKMLFSLLCLLPILCSGCTGLTIERQDIDRTEFIRVIGLDRSPTDPKKIRLTLASKQEAKESLGGTGGSGEGNSSKAPSQNAKIQSADGFTIFEAIRELQNHNDKHIMTAHVEYFLIGESAAKDNLLKYVDYISRDHEIRINANMFVTKGTTAEAIMQKSSESSAFMGEVIRTLIQNSKGLSVNSKIEIVDLMGTLDSEYIETAIPTLELLDTKNAAHIKSSINLAMNGYAIFKGIKLLTYLDRDTSQGLTFIWNQAASGVISVHDLKGQNIALEMINFSSQVIPQFQGEKLSILVKANISSNIDEIHSTDEIFNEKYHDYLNQQQAAVVKNELQKVITFAQQNNVDILKLSNAIHIQHPIRWEKIKKSWTTLFPKLPITIMVKSKINRSYDIEDPNRYKRGIP